MLEVEDFMSGAPVSSADLGGASSLPGQPAVRRQESRVLSLCVVTYLPSPYQVELFNALATQPDYDLCVVYLRKNSRMHKWGELRLKHRHCFVDGWSEGTREAWRWSQESNLTVFNYYTHWFALAAFYTRFRSGRPWAFWGERPGYLRLGMLGKLVRKLLLRPLSWSAAPVWAVGRRALTAYRLDWGEDRAYSNVPYTSNLARFQERAPRDSSADLTILFSGVLTRRKGVLPLARAFSEVARDHPRLRLIVLGSGPLEAPMREVLKSVEDQVTWHGFVTWDKVPEQYSRADVLCLPTRYDGWGMVIPEAMAAGLPVLSTRNAGAARELLKEGVNGWFLPGLEAADIAESFRRLLALSRDELQKLSLAARSSVADVDLKGGVRRFKSAVAQAMTSFQCRVEPLSNRRSSTYAASTRRIPHLFVTGTYALDKLVSMDRYARLVGAAATRYAEEITTVAPPPMLARLPLPSIARRLLGHVDKHVIFPFLLRCRICWSKHPQDAVVHVTDQGMSTTVPWVRDFPLVVTVHDLIALRLAMGEIGPGELPRSSTWFQFWNAKALDGARTIVCVSRKTLRDCQHVLKRPHKYLVVSNPVDPAFASLEAVDPVPALPHRFLLHVGNSFFYKNRPAVLRIFCALEHAMANPPELVMMGSPLTFEERNLVKELGIGSRLHFYASPPDSWLKTAYQKAQALIFPSLDEGFGWPVLEALSLGCPVFATHREPFTEVGGDAAEYIDPARPMEAAVKIAAFLRQPPEWMANRIEEGKKRAAEFSMRKFAESLERAYAVASGALPHPHP